MTKKNVARQIWFSSILSGSTLISPYFRAIVVSLRPADKLSTITQFPIRRERFQ
jgi:hypothetical protein